MTEEHSALFPEDRGCSHGNTSSLLTFFLLLGHDGVAEGQQSEEGVDLWVLKLHRLHQGVVVEHEARVGQRIEGEVHCLCVLFRQRGGGVKQRTMCH